MKQDIVPVFEGKPIPLEQIEMLAEQDDEEVMLLL